MKKVRILSIDGGGIRGIIPGTILTYLEKQLQLKSNSNLKIGDYFDFIAGTSTGGILACIYLMPGDNGKARYSAQDAVNLYLQKGEDIFHRTLIQKLKSGGGLLDEKYDRHPIEKYLDEYFGDTWLKDLIKPCLITSYDVTQRNAHFFTSTDAGSSLYNFKVRDVARATSAAPTYFEPALIYSEEGQRLAVVDGGVYANNPALCAYAEARKTIFSDYLKDGEKINKPTAKDMIIVSVGTGTVKKPYHYNDLKNAGELHWLNPIIDILMSGNAETVDYQLQQMYKTLPQEDARNYYRLEPPLHEASSEMDLATSKNMEDLRQAGLTYVDNNKDLLDEIVEKVLS